jgi:hypothetical protein
MTQPILTSLGLTVGGTNGEFGGSEVQLNANSPVQGDAKSSAKNEEEKVESNKADSKSSKPSAKRVGQCMA